MAGLYWTHNVKDIMDGKINRMMMNLVNNNDATYEGTVEVVKRIRIYKEFADAIISDMEEMDRKEAEENEARKREAERRAKENAETNDAE